MDLGLVYLRQGAQEHRDNQQRSGAARKPRPNHHHNNNKNNNVDLWPAFSSEWTGASVGSSQAPKSPRSPPTSPTLSKQQSRGDSVLAGGMDGFMASSPDSAMTRQYALSRQVSEQSREQAHEDIITVPASPFEMRHGRRYLRDAPYLLPCDLVEMHRQSMRTMLGEAVFSSPVCAPVLDPPPKRVLEIGCGSAFWTSTTHDYFKSRGHGDISFTGFDIAPLAPNLREQGVDWTFVAHNGGDIPWPFPAESFDYIMIKDLSLAFATTTSDCFLEECTRVLQPGGHLEIWESDHVLRCVLPHSRTVPSGLVDAKDEEVANSTKTFLLTPGMQFAPAQNKFIQDSNSWIELACDKRNLPSTPCARVAEALFRESAHLCDFGSRRVAIPLTELPWEKERSGSNATLNPASRKSSRSGPSGKSSGGGGGGKTKTGSLTPEQAAIRHTALMTVMQKIESLEPVLHEFSGKNQEEWTAWWANMTSDLLEGDGVRTGECLEIGAWWARKKEKTT